MTRVLERVQGTRLVDSGSCGDDSYRIGRVLKSPGSVTPREDVELFCFVLLVLSQDSRVYRTNFSIIQLSCLLQWEYTEIFVVPLG